MLKNLIISIFALLISLLLLEVVVRIFLTPEGKLTKWDDRPEYYYRPKIISPDNKWPPEKQQGAFRIGVVGDSITYGPFMQFDDVYSKRLERMFNLNAIEPKLEVINYGVSGYSTAHEIEVVKRALRENADLILLQITLNDPELTPLDQQHENTVQRFGPLRPSPVMKKAMNYWKTLGFVLKRLHNTRTHYEYKKYFIDLFENKESWDNFYNSLKIISNLTKEQNKRLAAVVFPLFGQPINDDYPFKKIHYKISVALEELGIQYIDLLPYFDNIPPERLQVIPGSDFHPNEIGHRIAAEKIYKWLRRNKLAPQEYFAENITQMR